MIITWRPPLTLSWGHWWLATLAQHFALFSWSFVICDNLDHADYDDATTQIVTWPETFWDFPLWSHLLEEPPEARDVRGTWVNSALNWKVLMDHVSLIPCRVHPVISAFPQESRYKVFCLCRHRVKLLVVKVILCPGWSTMINFLSGFTGFPKHSRWDVAKRSLVIVFLV